MKKRILVIMAALLLLTGCAPTSTPETPPAQTTAPAAPAGTLKKLESYNEKGLYYFQNQSDDHYANVVCYTDFEKATTEVVCGVPDCLHMDDSCDTFVHYASGNNVLFASDNTLYWLEPENLTNDWSPGVYSAPRLESTDLQGNNRRTLLEYPDSPPGGSDVGFIKLESVLFSDGAYLYLIKLEVVGYREPYYPCYQRTLLKLDAQSGAQIDEFLISLEDEETLESIFAIGVHEDEIVFARSSRTIVDFEDFEVDFFAISTTDGAKTDLLTMDKSVQQELFTESAVDDCILAVKSDGSLWKINVYTKEEEKLLLGDSFPGEIYIPIKWLNGYIFFSTFDQATEEDMLVALNVATKELTEIELYYFDIADKGRSTVGWPFIVYGDELFVLNESDAREVPGLGTGGEPITQWNYRYTYALIDFQDYLNSRPNYRVITLGDGVTDREFYY